MITTEDITTARERFVELLRRIAAGHADHDALGVCNLVLPDDSELSEEAGDALLDLGIVGCSTFGDGALAVMMDRLH